MRKRNKGRILSRPKNQRKALLRNLANSLFLHGKIKTTEAKAKELPVVKKLVTEIAPQYKARQGGYTRIMKLGPRKSDGARMAIIELVK